MTTMTRKAFLGELAGGAVLLVVGGCGGGGGDYGGGSMQPAGSGCVAGISGNHGHTLTIPAADLDSPTAKTYNIQGAADHNHQVTFSAADLANLKAGRAVTVTSTETEAHQHVISETCS